MNDIDVLKETNDKISDDVEERKADATEDRDEIPEVVEYGEGD